MQDKKENMKVESQLENFLKSSFFNNRSPSRTKIMHSVILEQLQNAYPRFQRYDWKFEWRLKHDGLGGTFDVDIVGFKNNEAKVFVLCKSINSSFAKNAKNYANNMLGEMHRIMHSKIVVPELVLFINIFPRILPVFDGKGNVKSFDDVIRSKKKTDVQSIMSDLYEKKVFEINVGYDIDNIKSLKKRSQFMQIIPKNIDKFVIPYED